MTMKIMMLKSDEDDGVYDEELGECRPNPT